MKFFRADKLREIKQEETKEKHHTILIVDDEKENLRNLQETLEDEYHVLAANHGEEALQLVKTSPDPEQIHLIISDQRMPELTGVEFLAQTIPVIPGSIRMLLTAFADVDAIIDAINKGQIYKFIMKPFDRDDLLLTVKRALEAYEMEEELKKHRTHLEELVKERTQALEEANLKLEEKNRQIQTGLEIAAQFQQAVLPPVQNVPFLDIVIQYTPFYQVSGDVYEMYTDEEGALNVFIGDAVGHGVAAAFMTMMVHIGLDTLQNKKLSVNETLDGLNQILNPRTDGKFVTGVLVRITPEGKLIASNAGHPPLIVIPADGSEIVKIKKGGPVLGAFHIPYQTDSYQLQEGDQFFIYTDGWYEWPNPEYQIFGFSRFLNLFQENRDAEMEELLNRLLETLKEFSQGRSNDDDMTLLGFKYKKPKSS